MILAYFGFTALSENRRKTRKYGQKRHKNTPKPQKNERFK